MALVSQLIDDVPDLLQRWYLNPAIERHSEGWPNSQSLYPTIVAWQFLRCLALPLRHANARNESRGSLLPTVYQCFKRKKAIVHQVQAHPTQYLNCFTVRAQVRLFPVHDLNLYASERSNVSSVWERNVAPCSKTFLKVCVCLLEKPIHICGGDLG